jgi:hypothetical protein
MITKNRKGVIVGCIYRHPGMSVDVFNNEYLTPILNKASIGNKTLILMEDFNIDLMRSDTNTEYSKFLDIISSHSLLPHIIHPTRVSTHSHTLIDNIFCSTDQQDTMSGNILTNISDHLTQFLILKNWNHRDSHPTRNNRDWSRFNEKYFLAKIHSLNWKEVLQINDEDPNLAFGNFYNRIDELLDDSAPVVQKKYA